MIPPDLPAELKSAIERKLHGLSRNDTAQRSFAISQTYRDGGNSKTIKTETDAMAYALARMPATYAAVAATLNALREVRPEFAPATLLDIGAGPGTATWAVRQAFSTIASTLMDSNTALRELALELTGDDAHATPIDYRLGEARALVADAQSADLVLASYVINEISEPERVALADALWDKTRDILLIVEPGTPAGYQRILQMRSLLIAKGAHVIAPCPHDQACPLIAPDWCHFAQRLPRSRAHQQVKGALLPFEDEKFSYVALSRSPPAIRPSRVLAQPDVNKIAVTAKLCTPAGVELARIPRRDKTAAAIAKKMALGRRRVRHREHARLTSNTPVTPGRYMTAQIALGLAIISTDRADACEGELNCPSFVAMFRQEADSECAGKSGRRIFAKR